MLSDSLLGTPKEGVTVDFSFSLVPGQGTANPATGFGLTVTSTQTDATGTVSTLPTLGNMPGLYQISGILHQPVLTLCFPGTSMFSVTASSAQPLLSISTGDAQIGVVGSTVTTPLTVLVQTASSVPVAGVTVNFSVPASSGAAVTPASATTTATGLASTFLKIGGVPADYYVTCHCTNCTQSASTVTFHACGKLPNANFQQGGAVPWANYHYDNDCSSTPQRRQTVKDMNLHALPANCQLEFRVSQYILMVARLARWPM
jgi:hypothetical protein